MCLQATEISTPSPYELYLEQFDKSVRQEIAGRNMDPIKLLTMLRIKFSGAYEVQMMHNTYSIKAPRRLTTGEIAQCRRMRRSNKSPRPQIF